MTTRPASHPFSYRRTPVLGAALVAVALVSVACIPYWAPSGTVSATPAGPYAVLSWDAAIDEDEGEDVERYEIDLDGQNVATVDHPATECVLIGLAASTTYTVEVFADGNGASSRQIGENETWIRSVSAEYTTGGIADSGSTATCVPTTDSDGDRLPDAVETATGTLSHAGDTGTNPLVADSDGDGIGDGDETLGTTAGLDLPAMGASPVHKDLLMEFDWFNDNTEPGTCNSHSHRPTTNAITRVSAAFGNSPVVNIDGTTGVNLIADYGQGSPFTGGNHVSDADGVIAGNVYGSDYADIRAANFAADREGYFHYTLLPHRYNTSSSSSGYAEFQGDDMIVSLYCYGSDGNVANTIMHEVGHNLGLWHGGDSFTNWKPNYNSVMNYLYQFSGVDNDCTPAGDGVLDYSSGSNIALNENALLEKSGICGSGSGIWVDWDGDSLFEDNPVSADINCDYQGVCDGSLNTLTDHDDWSSLYFAGAAAGAELGRSATGPVGITEQPVPLAAQD